MGPRFLLKNADEEKGVKMSTETLADEDKFVESQQEITRSCWSLLIGRREAKDEFVIGADVNPFTVVFEIVVGIVVVEITVLVIPVEVVGEVVSATVVGVTVVVSFAPVLLLESICCTMREYVRTEGPIEVVKIGLVISHDSLLDKKSDVKHAGFSTAKSASATEDASVREQETSAFPFEDCNSRENFPERTVIDDGIS